MRKLTIRVLLVSATFGIGISAVLVVAWFLSERVSLIFDDGALAQQIAPPSDAETKAQEVTVCDLKNDPAKYNHSLVKLTGYFSRGFEDSSLYDPSCKSRQWIWVELGGKKSVNVMYCCNVPAEPTREKELEIDGIKLPLTEDAALKHYDKLLEKGKNVKATVIGTFFSGEKVEGWNGSPAYYGGYGHMGMNSLFVVQQVLSSEVIKAKN
jgi:hypothetical protein